MSVPSLVEILRAAHADLGGQDRPENIRLRLKPPMAAGEMDKLARALGAPLPGPVRELLGYARGFEILTTDVAPGQQAQRTFSWGGITGAIVEYGDGDYTVADVDPHSGEWGAIVHCMHDPWCVIYAAYDLGDWMRRLFDAHRAVTHDPADADFDDYHAQVLEKLSEGDGHLAGGEYLTRRAEIGAAGDLTSSSDELIARFASSLPPDAVLFDLRQGIGYEMDLDERFPPSKTKVVRAERSLVFAAGNEYAIGRRDRERRRQERRTAQHGGLLARLFRDRG